MSGTTAKVTWYLLLTSLKKSVASLLLTEFRTSQIGITDPVAGEDNWTIIDTINGSGGSIDGVEIQWNHAWDNGFGANVNYTYANGDSPAGFYPDRIGSFTESSQNSFNLVGFWENDMFSARAAYNWRSEYMIRESGFYDLVSTRTSVL